MVWHRLALVGLLLLAACPRQQPPAPTISALPAVTLRTADALLYTFFDSAATRFVSTTDEGEIPATQRSWVRVVALEMKADERPEHELVYVVDLDKAGDDGSLPYIVVSRRAFELAGQNRGARPADAATAADGALISSEIVLYGTRWCRACTAAAAYLTQKGVAFISKDIEADQAAALELAQKAQAQGISPSGVPVIDVRGILVQGFDRNRLDNLLTGGSA